MFCRVVLPVLSLFSVSYSQSYTQGSASLSSGSITVNLDYDTALQEVTITLSGPSSSWFGVGFGSTTMSGYAIIIDSTGFDERSLVSIGNAGEELTNSFFNATEDVTGDTRTYTLRRDMTVEGSSSSDYYTFSDSDSSINLIWAIGGTADWNGEKHTSKGKGSITLTSTSGDDDDGDDDDDDTPSSSNVGDDDNGAYHISCNLNMIIINVLLFGLFKLFFN